MTAAAPVLEPVGDTGAPFPIVGIGASAGGLAAFEAFFAGMPQDEEPGMAFVLVQHLSPDHESCLAEIVRKYTRMRVFDVVDGMTVEVNCTYIIPPNRDMAFLHGALYLVEPLAPRGQRLPIDYFFRSLAQDQRERAIGVVLSGTGSDGTLGARSIKAEGGLVVVQTPASSEFDGMPRSAIASGVADYHLDPGEMPARLVAYSRRAFGKRLATESALSENTLQKVFLQLRIRTGHDFSQYKPSTTLRRLERRMAVHQIDTLGSYVKYLQTTPAEADALFADILIGVTSFFRDPETFLVLEQKLIPRLFEGKPAGSTIRVWIAGCSTGEEAYSIAMLLQERLEVLKCNYRVQVFATDIDPQAIATARAGYYSASVAGDLTPDRVARFLVPVPDQGGYRIQKNVRDLLVFSEQNLIRDPPFSKLDLITCRNLLIYLGSDLQKKVIPMFHYALNPTGVLLLGSSETVGEFSDLFAPLDRKAKVYRRCEAVRPPTRASFAGFSPLAPKAVVPSLGAGRAVLPARLSPKELTERALLQHATLFGALVNGLGDVAYLHGRSGMYLEPSPGEPGTHNILAMAREGLRGDLTLALRKAVSSKEKVCRNNVLVKTNGHHTAVHLLICPLEMDPQLAPERAQYLIVLQDAPSREAGKSKVDGTGDPGFADADGTDSRLAELSRALHAKEEYLQAANEELEASNEEMQSSNEEMQSVNEELQSSNEELETSKEELQSINEELITVNAELHTKVLDLSRASNDMNNLLASTGVGTVFVDHQLRILRFTPAATQIINLIAADVGRPVAHIVSNLQSYNHLVADTQAVLDTLIPKEVDVQAKDGNWYKMRILPYRTVENVIEGAVITFMNISENVRAREALGKANAPLRLAIVVRDAYDAITVQDLDGRIIAWNPGATRLYGWSEEEALTMNVRDRIPSDLQATATKKVEQLSRDEVLQPYRTQRLTKSGDVVDIWMTATALENDKGSVYAIATTERAKRPTKPPPAAG